MKKISYGLIVLWMLMCSVTSSEAQVSIGIGLPGVSIGINLPLFPELTRVPGYPVYYAPQMDSNYFFYDGMYWVYQDDNWYASSWYNGPWGFVEPYAVPLYVLRIPVRYYRQPPVYFRGWQSNAPPRWGQHWGRGWEQQRRGWDKWNRRSAPAPAPLPVYQRQYSGDRYPRVEQQHTLRSQQYRYQPRDKAVKQHFNQVEQQRSLPPVQRQQREQQQKQQNDQRQQQQQQNDQRQQQKQQNDQRQQQKQQNDQRQQQQKQQNDQRQQQQQNDQRQQQKQQNDQRQQKQQNDQRQQQQQNDQRQQQQKQQNDQKQQQQQQNDQRQQREQQQAPRAQEREQRQQDRGASQEPGQGRGQGQNKDDERGRGRDK